MEQNNWVKFFLKYRLDVINLFLLSLLSPLYFYKLGQTSLVSWDEAWYGVIARNIINSGNFLALSYNDGIYSDHPPAGFWIMAVFQFLFGSNEFGVRVGSAIFGMIGLYFVYLIGRDLFSRTAGFASALALSSTYWYLYRARSGNLDIFLAVFLVLAFYFAFKSLKNSKFLYPFAVSLALALLTKSLVPFTIIPALAVIFFKTKIKLKEWTKPLILFLIVMLPWFAITYFTDRGAFNKYVKTGSVGVGSATNYYENFMQIKEYLHFGVGKWFWPGVLGIFGGLISFNRGLVAISVLCLSFFAPFILSDRGQLWHLIPLYPFMTLGFFGFCWVACNFLIDKLFVQAKKELRILLMIGLLAFCAYFAYMQIKRSWYEFIDIPAFVSDEAILSREAAKYPQQFYIDGSEFTPAAYFYSGKHVEKIWDERLPQLFEEGKPFVMITYQWRLNKYNIPANEYEVIKTDRDKILIIRK